MKNGDGHLQVWVDEIKRSWVNDLGLNYNHYIGFGKEKLPQFLEDLEGKILGKRVTIDYVENKTYKYVHDLKLL